MLLSGTGQQTGSASSAKAIDKLKTTSITAMMSQGSRRHFDFCMHNTYNTTYNTLHTHSLSDRVHYLMYLDKCHKQHAGDRDEDDTFYSEGEHYTKMKKTQTE